jgi:predicted enzyme related to lactoylglutathione lyase
MFILKNINTHKTSYMEAKNKNPNNPVVWFEIYVDDFSRAIKFYETVLDLNFSKMPDPNRSGLQMAAFPMKMDAPNSSGALVKMEGVKAGGNSTIVYFACEDCAVEEGRVSNAGGKVFKSKMSIGEHGFISICVDTEGNMFGLHSMK